MIAARIANSELVVVPESGHSRSLQSRGAGFHRPASGIGRGGSFPVAGRVPVEHDLGRLKRKAAQESSTKRHPL
jgi:hypothetical protein